MKQKRFAVRLAGLRPLMLDRYAGDNATQLQVQDKMYLKPDGRLYLPATNLYSMLCARASSVVTKFFPKSSKDTVRTGIEGFTTVEPFDIDIIDESGAPIRFNGFNDKIKVRYDTARVQKGKGTVPNPKVRPIIELPWGLEFEAIYTENPYCTESNFQQAFEWGGIVGIGTFRPFFGRYEVTQWEQVK